MPFPSQERERASSALVSIAESQGSRWRDMDAHGIAMLVAQLERDASEHEHTLVLRALTSLLKDDGLRVALTAAGGVEVLVRF